MDEIERAYLKTLDRMTSDALAKYTISFIDKAVKIQENLSSLLSEIQLLQKVLTAKLGKEKK